MILSFFMAPRNMFVSSLFVNESGSTDMTSKIPDVVVHKKMDFQMSFAVITLPAMRTLVVLHIFVDSTNVSV